MLDLNEPSPNDLHGAARPLPLKDGRGKPLGDPQVILSVVGCYSRRYFDAQRTVTVKAFRQIKTSDAKDIVRQLVADNMTDEILVACVVGWESVAEAGAPAPCTPERVRKLLAGYPFVRDQVDTFVHGERNFTQGGSPTSPDGPSADSPSTSPTP